MLFKSFGVAVATNLSSPSDEAKPITLRFPESEIALYDVLAKTMGLTRQDFFQHLIRSCYRDAFKDFVIGYNLSNPSVKLQEVMESHAPSEDLKNKINSILYSICLDIYSQDEKDFHDAVSAEDLDSQLSFDIQKFKGVLK